MIFNGLKLASPARVDQFAFDGSSDRLLPERPDLHRVIIRRVALDLIRLYQIHVSPRKGFNCPYRELHGELSCSSYVSRLLQVVRVPAITNGELIPSSFSQVFQTFPRLCRSKHPTSFPKSTDEMLGGSVLLTAMTKCNRCPKGIRNHEWKR